MRNSEVVASIVAGDPQGLAAAYDRYADSLYTYCRSVLRDPADAADAVQDTYVIAASRLDGLRDPDKLRPWLYAVARNECTRILRAGKDTSALDEAPDVIDESADVGADAERDELRGLFRDASEGLNASERELIELSLRHKMEADEIADVLGVSKNHAHSLLSRARNQLEACLGALLVGRAGRDECKELGALLGEWDGTLTVLLRKRLHRHIERCATCTKRRAFELRPAAFSGLPPLVAIAGTLRMLAIPAAIKAKVLALATGTDPAAAEYRATVVHHAGSFNHEGFPHAVHAGKADALHAAAAGTGAFIKSPQGRGTAAAVLIAVVAAVTTLALTGNSDHVTMAIAKPGHSNASGEGAGTGSGGAAGSGGSHNSGHTSRHTGGSGSGTTLGTSQPSPAAAAARSTYEPSPATSPPAKSPASPAPGQGPVPPPASSSPAPTSPPTPSGIVTAKPNGGLLTIPPGGTTITLTNSGSARAYWTMTVSGGSGAVQVSPASGWIAPGKTASVRVTTTSGAALGQTITLAPGGTSWTVLLGL
ncbi:MAG TPA: sigma-70 family RNA polymerase sigma factor [Trebonia sp.]